VCTRARYKLRCSQLPEYFKAIDRWAKIKKAYGVTQDQYNAKLKEQAGSCAICLVVTDKVLAVDHCHGTGQVRGLLCNLCNLGLAAIERDGFVERAQRYLGSYMNADKTRAKQPAAKKNAPRKPRATRKANPYSAGAKSTPSVHDTDASGADAGGQV
jgi:hypothetical protein